MSVVEQGAASRSEAEIGIPEFPIGLRGYDRQQVDMYVKDLAIRVTAERRRAEGAERATAQLRAELANLRNNQAPLSFEHLGAEAARVLEAAGTSAKLLIEEASHRGEAIAEEAEAQARDLLDQAERRAGELEAEAGQTLSDAAGERERILAEAAQAVHDSRVRADEEVRTSLAHARDEADRTRQKAMSERAIMQAETERLRESRDRMLEYLGRIHTDLGALLAEAAQPEPVEAVGAIVAPTPTNGHLSMEDDGDDADSDDEDEDDDAEDDGEEGEQSGASYRAE